MNLNLAPETPSDDDNQSLDSWEELYQQGRRARPQTTRKAPKLKTVKVYVKLEKHREIFEFKLQKNSTISDMLDHFFEKNWSSLKKFYKKENLRVYMATVHGKKKNFPRKLDSFHFYI